MTATRYEWQTPECQASTGLPKKPAREPFVDSHRILNLSMAYPPKKGIGQGQHKAPIY
jgi:hypothetical protein